MATLTPSPVMQFFDAAGVPLSGGKLYTYDSGTAVPAATYTDASGIYENTNPVILNSRGEANIWLGSSPYSFTLKDSDDTLIWTADNVSGLVAQVTYEDYVASLAAYGGAALVGYSHTMTVEDALNQYVSVKAYGAVGNGVTDDTLAVNLAIASETANGKSVFFPAGTYLVTQIDVLPKMNIMGESPVTTIIKLKSGTNPAEGSAALVWSSSYDMDDACIQNMRFDGNKAGNTIGNVICLYGNRTVINNVVVVNAASNGIITNHNPNSAERLTGIEGHYRDITIDSPNKSGWVHYGPNDSNFDNIIIIDPSVGTNKAHYGMYLGNDTRGAITTSGNGRFNNLHVWNRGSTTNVPLAGVQVITAGNTFANCHFECGDISLNISGNFNVFAACDYYAPDGDYAVYVYGNTNNLSGTVWHYAGLPAYTGVLLYGTGNTINLTCDAGSVASEFIAIEFNDASTGYNNVSLTGYISAISTPYTGTPSADDFINILLNGPGGTIFTQNPAASWTAYTPTIFSGAGSITSYTATGTWIKIGNVVQYQMAITVTDNGTGSGAVYALLPAQSKTNSVGAGRNSGTGDMLSALTIPSGTHTQISLYDGTYPVASTQTLYVSGSYEPI